MPKNRASFFIPLFYQKINEKSKLKINPFYNQKLPIKAYLIMLNYQVIIFIKFKNYFI